MACLVKARIRPILILTLAGALASCAVGPNFKRPKPPAATDYGSASRQSDTVATDVPGGNAQQLVAAKDIPADWWSLFQSPKLNQLVEQALRSNPNVTSAEAALRQAHELYAAQRSTFWPMAQGSLAATRSEFSANSLTNPTVSPTATYSLYTTELSVSYVPDVFGGNRRAAEASRAQAESSRFQLEATYLTLSSNVVVTAIQEASLRGQISATERLVELEHELTHKVRQQQVVGTASNLDVLNQEAVEAQTAATLPGLQKQLSQTRDALTALLGRLPSEEPAEEFRLEELTLPVELPVSLPSRLVEQRPDVRQAEQSLHIASAQVGVALADMLPQFTITADIGSSALSVNQLFKTGNGFWDVGASLTQTLFDAGALLHKHRAAVAALDQAGAQYRAAVIVACQNVADTLHALQADAQALKASAEAERAAKSAFDLARQQREIGTINFVAVLNAEASYQQAEIGLVQARANRYADTAALFQALGGGWWNRPQGHAP
jgi:NodT family efflux transporter outer membrane factor (OMF) lipoprotein